MCPTLLSVAVIKHSAEATWEGKGLCGLHSSGNALEGKIQSESQTATHGERLMISGSCSADIQTQHRTSRPETLPMHPHRHHSATISQMWAQVDLIWSIPQMTLGYAQLHQKEPKNKAYLDILLSKCIAHYRSLKVTVFFSVMHTVLSESVTLHIRSI